MNLEDINYIAQTLGVVAILGTFVAVLIQMRQTNRLLRNQAKRAQIDSIKSVSEALYQTPGLADMVARAAAGGLEALTEAERMQLIAFQTTTERTWEAMHQQFLDGQIDTALWQAHLEQARATWRTSAVVRAIWAARAQFFTAQYQAFHAAEIEHGTGDTLYTIRDESSGDQHCGDAETEIAEPRTDVAKNPNAVFLPENAVP